MDLDFYSNIFKALSHPIRLKIALGLMKKHECNVSVMVEKLGVSQPMVSQHLIIMKNAGVITSEKKGTQVCYRIKDEMIERILKSLEVEICE
jgi:ArsR family transcriptional regulator